MLARAAAAAILFLGSMAPARADARVGDPAPAFTGGLSWRGAPPLDWQALRGKVVVFETFSRRSDQGRRAAASFRDALGPFAQSDAVVAFLLHTQGGAEGADAYLSKRDPGVTVALDTDGEFGSALGADDRSPLTVIVDRGGIVRHAGDRPDNLVSTLVETLKIEWTPGADAPADGGGSDGEESEAAPAQRDADGFPAFTGDVGAANNVIGRRLEPVRAGHWLSGPAPNLEGKVVVVDFWATWCGPCIANFPHANRLVEKLAGEPVEIVAISDEPPSLVRQTMERHEMNFHVAVDQSQRVRGPVANRVIPYAIIMSSDNVVRWQGHPARITEDLLRRIIEADKRMRGAS